LVALTESVKAVAGIVYGNQGSRGNRPLDDCGP